MILNFISYSSSLKSVSSRLSDYSARGNVVSSMMGGDGESGCWILLTVIRTGEGIFGGFGFGTFTGSLYWDCLSGES